MSDINKKTLGEILSASQIITQEDVTAALDEQKRVGCRFGEALVSLGIVAQEDIDWALSNQLDIPYIRLKQEMIDPDAIALISGAMARSFTCIPLIRAGGELNIAMADPLNRTAVEAIEMQSGCTVNVSVALNREIREMIDIFYGSDREENLGFTSAVFPAKALDAINADLESGVLLEYLLVFILQNRLSSLSLQPFEDVVQISGKRGGTVSSIGSLPPEHYPGFSRRVRTAASIQASAATTADGTLTLSYRSRTVTFQVAIMQGSDGDYMTIRQQITAPIPERLAELNLQAVQETAFTCLARCGQGVTWFASRNARERNSFMGLMLEEMQTGGRNVIILGQGRAQDRFPRIPLPESGAECARLIMESLEHDPDVLVIEDATEGPAFAAACRAALRGRQVLAGLGIHGTRNALRHLQYQQRNGLLPAFVNGLVTFAGIQLLCTECRTEYVPLKAELAAMGLEQPLQTFYRSSGCEACGHSGFSRRRFLLDIIPFDEGLLRLLDQAGNEVTLENYLKTAGSCGIEREALALLNRGEVSPEEYIEATIF